MTIQINKTTNNMFDTAKALNDIYISLGSVDIYQLTGRYEIKVDIKKIE